MFKKFGNILSSKVVMSEDGNSKGYGFVQFETEESANVVIDKSYILHHQFPFSFPPSSHQPNMFCG